MSTAAQSEKKSTALPSFNAAPETGFPNAAKIALRLRGERVTGPAGSDVWRRAVNGRGDRKHPASLDAPAQEPDQDHHRERAREQERRRLHGAPRHPHHLVQALRVSRLVLDRPVAHRRELAGRLELLQRGGARVDASRLREGRKECAGEGDEERKARFADLRLPIHSRVRSDQRHQRRRRGAGRLRQFGIAGHDQQGPPRLPPVRQPRTAISLGM